MVKHLWVVLFIFLPCTINSQINNGQPIPQRGIGWWLWTVILLVVVALIVRWAVRAGNRSGPSGNSDKSSTAG
ncbi:hypothetical protein CHISP_2630 [Chitinispirillum alkaliphilum]|nr:hypothetical protein CHISP_2630 [Chitinispirillum alkaliphilum]